MKSAILAIWLLLAGGAGVSSLEINAKSGLLLFNSGLQDSAAITGDSSPLKFIERLSISQHYNDAIGLDLTLEHDPILLNRIMLLLGYETAAFNIQGGPFIGLFNGPMSLNPGVFLKAGGKVSSLLFGSFQFEATLHPGVNQPGDYAQSSVDLQIGVGLPLDLAAIGGLNLKTHTQKQENNAALTSDRTRYTLKIARTEPLWLFSRLSGTLGYQKLGWIGSYGSGYRTYQQESYYAGLDLGVQLLPSLQIYGGIEIPIYTKISQNIQAQSPEPFLWFEFFLGAIWRFDPRR